MYIHTFVQCAVLQLPVFWSRPALQHCASLERPAVDDLFINHHVLIVCVSIQIIYVMHIHIRPYTAVCIYIYWTLPPGGIGSRHFVTFVTFVTLLAYYAWPRTYPSRSCKRNPWREHVHRATRRRSQAIDMAWRHVALATARITWRHVAMAQEIVSRQKHNMLSLLYATCLKLLVFQVVFECLSNVYFFRIYWKRILREEWKETWCCSCLGVEHLWTCAAEMAA